MSADGKNWCRHYNGTVNKVCDAGVDYDTVKQTRGKGRGWDVPCTNTALRHFCAVFAPKTPEEIAEDKRLTEFIGKLNAFASGTSRVCPTCGAEVTGARLYAKSEPDIFSLYTLPCNCRHGLWEKAPEWITDVEIVPLRDREDEDEAT